MGNDEVKPNEIVKLLLDEHEECLRDLNAIGEGLHHAGDEEWVWERLEELLKFIEKFRPHFLKEADILFRELDKSPKKGVHISLHNDLFPLVKMEHKDWEAISFMATQQIENAVKYKNEKVRDAAIAIAEHLILFIKRHFALEEAVVFPMVLGLSEEKQASILPRLKATRL